MQYTLRNIPLKLDESLRRKAKAEGKSLNQVAIDALSDAMGLADKAVKRRDLSDIAGTWVEDSIFDEVRADHERIDPEKWQ